MKNLIATYQRLYGYVQPYRGRYLLALLITLPLGAMDGLVAWAIQPFMDSVLMTHNIVGLVWVPALIIAFNVVQGVLRYYETYLNEFLAQKVIMRLRKDLFLKLQQMAMPYFFDQPSGFLSARYFIDPSRVQRAIVDTLRVILTKGVTALCLVGVMVAHSWQLSLVAVSIISLILLPIVIIRKRLSHLANQEVVSSGRLLTVLNETFFGIKTLRSFNALAYQNRRFDEAQQENYYQIMKMAQIKGFLSPVSYIISAIGIAAILWYGSYLVILGQETPGTLMSFLVAMIMLYRPIKGLGTSAVDAQKALASAQRIFEILDDPNIHRPNPGARSCPPLRQGIAFQHVWFRYADDAPWALRDVTLIIPQGQTVALVGSSGSGKTTLVELLMGFYPNYTGSITLDGVSIEEIEFKSLCRQVATVSQDIMLFNGTLWENIVLGNTQATEDQVIRALQLAYLQELVDSLPQGLQTPIGERGVKLSGGQRQRLAIARAILKDAPILILDEATSALDNESEALVQKALAGLMENRTVLVIAHRLSTIRRANTIVVLDQGSVVESGTHESLISQPDGVYQRLYRVHSLSQEPWSPLPPEDTSALLA